MPTFKFIKNGQEVAQVSTQRLISSIELSEHGFSQVRGADPRTLSATVAQHAGSAPSVASTDSVSSPHGKSLLSQLDKSSLSCLNEAAAHSLKDLLGHGYLQSDADEQVRGRMLLL